MEEVTEWREELLEESVTDLRGGGRVDPSEIGDWMRTEQLVTGDLIEKGEALAWKTKSGEEVEKSLVKYATRHPQGVQGGRVLEGSTVSWRGA
jgi:hypothetical protein